MLEALKREAELPRIHDQTRSPARKLDARSLADGPVVVSPPEKPGSFRVPGSLRMDAKGTILPTGYKGVPQGGEGWYVFAGRGAAASSSGTSGTDARLAPRRSPEESASHGSRRQRQLPRQCEPVPLCAGAMQARIAHRRRLNALDLLPGPPGVWPLPQLEQLDRAVIDTEADAGHESFEPSDDAGEGSCSVRARRAPGEHGTALCMPSAVLSWGLSRMSQRRNNRELLVYSDCVETVLALNMLAGYGDFDHPVRRGPDGGTAGPRSDGSGELKKGQGNGGADGTAEAG